VFNSLIKSQLNQSTSYHRDDTGR